MPLPSLLLVEEVPTQKELLSLRLLRDLIFVFTLLQFLALLVLAFLER